MSKHDAVGQLLQERLDRLVRRVGTIEGDLRSAGDRDWQERASEVENDDVLEGLDDNAGEEIRQDLGGLSRIESGRYGTCADCGRPISAERLTAVPTAVTCLACTTRRALAPTGR